MGIEIWGPKRGPKRGSFWLLEMSQNSGVLPIVYLHAGLEIKFAILYAIQWESNRGCHAFGSQRSQCHSEW